MSQGKTEAPQSAAEKWRGKGGPWLLTEEKPGTREEGQPWLCESCRKEENISRPARRLIVCGNRETKGGEGNLAP